MAFNLRNISELIVRSRSIYFCRSFSRLVKTDQFKIYKVDDEGCENTAGNSFLLRVRSQKSNTNFIEKFIGKLLTVFSSCHRILTRKMSDFESIPRTDIHDCDIKKQLSPPETVKGMKKLDRDAFSRDIRVLAIKVPLKAVTVISKKFKETLLRIPRIRPIAELSDSDPDNLTHKFFLFDPRKCRSIDDFSDQQVEVFRNESVDLQSSRMFELTLTYENWMYDEILDSILPETTGGVGGFSIVGHIAHLNLRDDLLEYKQLIGEVLLDKVSAVTTVVNKLNTIDNTFRNFQMEVLAGEGNFVTLAKEHGFSYQFDFSKVYWNSRLSTEHQRVVNLLREGDVVFDMFAGVGPFAIPAARKKCTVYANDLNPESFRWLGHNVKLNKIKGDVHLSNLDGRQFAETVIKKVLLDLCRGDNRSFKIHVIMNLPAIAIEFLDVFRGFVSRDDLQSRNIDEGNLILPNIHCYCFSKSENVVEDAERRVTDVLGHELPDSRSVRLVRNVAPNKEMLCVTFEMPREVLLGSDVSCIVGVREEPAEKKSRLASGGEI